MNIKKFFSNKQLSLLEGNYLKHNTHSIIECYFECEIGWLQTARAL